jgi:hypothetical protein
MGDAVHSTLRRIEDQLVARAGRGPRQGQPSGQA